MINVLHVADKLSVGDATIHGVTQLFSWWIPQFDQDRYKVSLCSLRTRDKAGAYLENKGIKVFYLGKGKFDPSTLTDLMSLIKQEQIDILHLHGYGSTTFGRICATLAGIPCIVHEHMFDSKIPFYQRISDQLLSRKTTRAIADSNSVKNFMIDLRGIPAEKIEVIYNGVPLTAFDEQKVSDHFENTLEFKKKYNIPPNNRLIGTVGRLNVIKGHTYFLQAAQQVLRECQDVTFLVVGDGELMESLKDECKELGIEQNVVFTGYVDDLPGLLSALDIKVISSLSEGLPLTLHEAMAAGCAIVSSDVGGIGEVIKDGQNGFLVPPQNPEAIGDKLLLLLKDPALCRAMAENARRESQEYDIRNTVFKLEACYEKVIA